jgi:zinc and cadmium transporter
VSPVAASLLSVIGVSLLSLLGLLTLGVREERVRRLTTHFISFATGGLLGDAFIHLVPTTFSKAGPSLPRSLALLGGILVFFVVEKVLRHDHGPMDVHSDEHAHEHDAHGHAVRRELVVMNLAGDAVHNLIDGVIIGASWLAGPQLGVTTTLAVLLHEIPHELGDFAVLIHFGLSVRRAAVYNLISASAAVAGTVATLLVGQEVSRAVDWLLPFTAGGFIYLAASGLIPELQRERGSKALLMQTSLIGVGIATMGLLTLVD